MRRTRARVIDKVSSLSDNIVFVGIFGIGFVGISVIRLATNTPSVVAMIIPLSLMCLYAYIVWRTERYRLREDRAADNIYYLGFLFTVTTLGVALVRYGASDHPDVNQIIGDLGVGLVTTIVGLVGRIFFGQLRQDPEEIEEQTRLVLSDVVEKTKARLFHTNNVIDDVHQNAIQIMRDAKDAIDATNKGVISSVEQLETKLDRIEIPEDIVSRKMEQALSRFEVAIDGFSQRVDRIDVPQDVLSKKMDRALNGLEISIGQFSTKINSIKVDPDLMERKVGDIVDPLKLSMESLGGSLDAAAKSFQMMSEHREELSEFAKLAEHLGNEKERIGVWGQTIAENESQLKLLNLDLVQTQQALKSAVTLVQELGHGASKQQVRFGQSIEEMLETITQVQGGVRQLSETTESLANNFARAMTDLVEVANRSSSSSRIAR
jgi:hypothetical protein